MNEKAHIWPYAQEVTRQTEVKFKCAPSLASGGDPERERQCAPSCRVTNPAPWSATTRTPPAVTQRVTA